MTLNRPLTDHQSLTTGRDVAVRIRGVRKTFGDTVALETLDLDVYKGEFLALLGPSGCGKTTLLRVIAGFEEPDGGEVLIGEREALSLPAYRRPVNTVFQSYALFPHLSVLENIRFGLRMHGVAKQEGVRRAERVMRMVEITELAGRKPAQLSGGQQQRVALARAIVNEPEVLLLDEPLGALDLKLRKQLQIELMQLQQRLGITFIYVTHDQEEALVMSDRIAVMATGKIEQLGRIEDVYERPKTRYVATFLGNANLIEGQVMHVEGHCATLKTRYGPLHSVGAYHTGDTGNRVTLCVRPEKVYVMHPKDASGHGNTLHGTVEEIIYTGALNHYRVRVGESQLSAFAMNKALTEHDSFAVGAAVALVIPARSLVRLED